MHIDFNILRWFLEIIDSKLWNWTRGGRMVVTEVLPLQAGKLVTLVIQWRLNSLLPAISAQSHANQT